MRLTVNSKKSTIKVIAPLRGLGAIPIVELTLYTQLCKEIGRVYRMLPTDVRFLMLAGILEGKPGTTISKAAGVNRSREFAAVDNLLASGHLYRKDGLTGHAARGLYLSDMGKEVINEMERVWDDLLRRYLSGQA